MTDFALSAPILLDIPCLVLEPRALSSAVPPVIVLHGLDRHKESLLPTLYALARRGLRAVAPDLRLHGERPGAAEREGLLESDYVGTMAEMIQGTSRDVSLLLDALQAKHAGIHGVSLGGYVAFAALADDPRVSTAAVAIGSPDWLEPLRAAGLAAGDPIFDAVAALSPLERAARVYPPRPILMLHGDADERVSITGVQELERRLRPHYQNLAAPLELVTYPGLGHFYTDDMAERSADWLARHLEKLEKAA